MKEKRNHNVLNDLRDSLKVHISEAYPTVEFFCSQRKLNKATVSNFLRGTKDFRISTIVKLANAIDKKLSIRFE
jgi:hypothetical protein